MAVVNPTAGMSPSDAVDHIRSVLDITIRISQVLFANGAGAEDTVAAMQAVTRAYGLRGVDADVTYSLITLTWENPATFETVSRSRNVKYRVLDYAKLTRASNLITRMIDDPPNLRQARRLVASIVTAPPIYPRWLRSVGWSLVGAGAAFLLGGGLIVAIASFVATLLVDLVSSALAKRRVPVFYQSFAGGLIGPIVAAVVRLIDPGVNASLVVVATIIMLLAGVTTFGAVHDTLAGFYVTGTARLVEAIVITAGLVAGVLGSTLLLGRFGLVLHIDPASSGSISTLPTQLAASVVIVIGFALASQIPARAFWAVALLGAVAEAVYALSVGAGVGIVFASAAAAVVAGPAGGDRRADRPHPPAGRRRRRSGAPRARPHPLHRAAASGRLRHRRAALAPECRRHRRRARRRRHPRPIPRADDPGPGAQASAAIRRSAARRSGAPRPRAQREGLIARKPLPVRAANGRLGT